MIQITLPDGAQIHSAPVRGGEIAARSGDAPADTALAIRVDGVLRDLGDLIEHDACVEIITRAHPEALELLRHDAAHVLAEAVKELYPETQVTIGPADLVSTTGIVGGKPAVPRSSNGAIGPRPLRIWRSKQLP